MVILISKNKKNKKKIIVEKEEKKYILRKRSIKYFKQNTQKNWHTIFFYPLNEKSQIIFTDDKIKRT